jgi:hypothetical protein
MYLGVALLLVLYGLGCCAPYAPSGNVTAATISCHREAYQTVRFTAPAEPFCVTPLLLTYAGKGDDGTYSSDVYPTGEALAVGPHHENPSACLAAVF